MIRRLLWAAAFLLYANSLILALWWFTTVPLSFLSVLALINGVLVWGVFGNYLFFRALRAWND